MTTGQLAQRVNDVKSSTGHGRPLSDSFSRYVDRHDRTRCVADIAFEDVWNGTRGWKSPDYFWDVIIYLWRKAPDFFVDYDPDREIVEDSAKWTQSYFDEQRNYLRHNFCLERLCHLVMVYEYLHGKEFVSQPREERKTVERQPSVGAGGGDKGKARLSKSGYGAAFWRGVAVGFAFAAILFATVFPAKKNSPCGKHDVTVALQQGQQEDEPTGSETVQSGKVDMVNLDMTDCATVDTNELDETTSSEFAPLSKEDEKASNQTFDNIQ